MLAWSDLSLSLIVSDMDYVRKMVAEIAREFSQLAVAVSNRDEYQTVRAMLYINICSSVGVWAFRNWRTWVWGKAVRM